MITTASAETSDTELPTPRKAMRAAIIKSITPTDVPAKRAPRKRVQHLSGEVLTEENAVERLRLEEEERSAKKKKGGKHFPKRKASTSKGTTKKKTANPVSRALFCEFSSSDEETNPKLLQKEKQGRWSSGESSDYDAQGFMEALGIAESDSEVDHVEPSPPAPSSDHPCPSSPRPGTSSSQPGPSSSYPGEKSKARFHERWVLPDQDEDNVHVEENISNKQPLYKENVT